MKYKKLDFLNKNVSAIALGSDYFGGEIPKEECFKILDEYVFLGGNVIDTARLYSDGKSEETIGEWLKMSDFKNKMTVITKCAHHKNGSKSRLSYEEIESDIDKSLKALKTEKIDLLFLHRDDPQKDAGEIINTLNDMVKKGKILTFGASNWEAERIFCANSYAEQNNLFGFSASEIKWGYAKNSPEYTEDSELVLMNEKEAAFYEKTHMPVFAFAPQAKGFFAKLAAGGTEKLSEKAKQRYLCDENLKRFEKLKILAKEMNVSVNAVNLAYLTSQKKICVVPVIGAKNKKQLNENLNFCDITLTCDMLEFLERTE